jgi:putative ABC transport system permease protein
VAPADEQETSGQFQRPGHPRAVFLNYNAVDWSFRETMRLPLLAGRFFKEGRGGDDASAGYNPYGEDAEALLRRGVNVVISASAARRFGFRSPADALGQQIQSPFLSRPELVPSTIVGVVGDARYRSVRDQARPTVYHVNTNPFTYLIVRYEGVDPRRLRSQVEAVWNELYPNVPFEADFAQDRVMGLYLADEARGQVFAAAAILAILVACLGLFGLAAFTAERRTKEIGIRKVFGARTRDILRLLLWQFCQPVLVANMIAWPVTWWLMRDWLNSFSDRIALHPGWFVGAGSVALIIAALTVAGHAFKVARLNPIHALRYE